MERDYMKIWWRHCLAIVGFSVIPLLIVNLALFFVFNRIYTAKVSEDLQNRVEERRDTLDLFLDERIAQIYMCPIVMSTTYGEREGKLYLTQAWEILGGKPCSGLCGYVQDSVSFELDEAYATLIEKKAENMYRTISQKMISLPASNQAVRQKVSAAPQIELTPQESEQLSKYASDDKYVQTQKEDIRELASHFKTLMDNQGMSVEDMLIKDFKEHFAPDPAISATFAIKIKEIDSPLAIIVKGETLDVHYGNVDKPDALCRIDRDKLIDITAGAKTFQRAFMTGEMQVKGEFKKLRILDTLFPFEK